MEEIIRYFKMIAHPEGGYYSETYLSSMNVPGINRQLMTAIYFLLPSGQVSKFHTIKSDELWFHHSGGPIVVHTLDENGHTEHHLGMDLNAGEQPQILIKAGVVFGSTVKVESTYALVSCVVAPGFDFRDFELCDPSSLLNLFPNHKEIINRLT